MKKFVIFGILPIFLILFLVLSFNHLPFQKRMIEPNEKNDTILIKHLLSRGDKLKGSNQDSCKYFYYQAIRQISLRDNSGWSNHHLGLAYIGLASLNCNMGNYPESSNYLDTVSAIAKKANDIDLQAQIINITGLLHFNQSNFDSANVCYEKALQLSRQAKNKQVEAKIYTNKAIIDYMHGNCDAAIENFSKTLEAAQLLKDVDLMTGTYLNMGLVASNFGEYQKAIDFYNKAIQLYQSIKGKDGLILCYQNLGSLYLSLGNFDKAMEAVDLSLKLSDEIGDKANTAKGHHNKAELYVRVGDFQQAMQEYLVSIRQKELLNDKAILAEGYNGLGNVYFQQSTYNKALEYYEKALQIDVQLNLSRGKSTTYSNIANVYAAKHLYTEALNYYQKALEIAYQIKNESGIADSYVSIGSIYAKMKQFQKAEDYLLKALQKKTLLAEREGIAMVNLELASAAIDEANSLPTGMQREKFEKAENYGLQAYHLSKELKALPVTNMASLLLKKAYKGMGNTSEALKYADIFSETNDSIYTRAKAEAITYAEARWSVEKHQQKIDLLESNQKLQDELLANNERDARQQKIITFISIALLVIAITFSVLLFFYFRRNRELLYQKQQHNLTILKMQNIRNRISPHFIFNALSSITHSIQDIEIIQKMENLTLLLRKVIENAEQTNISLEEEVKIASAFIDFQKDRIPAPFHFTIDIDPAINGHTLIPAMIIQIPVENSLKHGLMPMDKGPSELTIAAKKSDLDIRITITDNGLGLNNKSKETHGTGSGLKMIMQTIQLLNTKNKNKILFSMKERTVNGQVISGTITEIIIPQEYSFQL